MSATPAWPTPYPDVNAVLADLEARILTALGQYFAGMYLYGSLALGGFDPEGSDIDFLVATNGELPAEVLEALGELHRAFDASRSSWAARVEVAYVPVDVLRGACTAASKYPQIEKGERLMLSPLEIGWPYQCRTLRERGIAVAGPGPRKLIPPVRCGAMRQAAMTIVGGWVEQVRHDPEWLAWLRDRSGQAFVALTLCRLLYTLETGSVASKPEAAAWAAAGPARNWAALIERSLTLQRRHDETPESDIDATLALLEFSAQRLERSSGLQVR